MPACGSGRLQRVGPGRGFLQEPGCLAEQTVGHPLGLGPEASVLVRRGQQLKQLQVGEAWMEGGQS